MSRYKSMKVYKYDIPVMKIVYEEKLIKFSTPVMDKILTIDLPEGAVILSVDEQYNKPVLWALVDPSTDIKPRNLYFALTGQEIEANREQLKFIGTIKLDEGTFIVHVFEIIN